MYPHSEGRAGLLVTSLDGSNLFYAKSPSLYLYLIRFIPSTPECNLSAWNVICCLSAGFHSYLLLLPSSSKLLVNLNSDLRKKFVKMFSWILFIYRCKSWTLEKIVSDKLRAMKIWIWSWVDRERNIANFSNN